MHLYKRYNSETNKKKWARIHYSPAKEQYTATSSEQPSKTFTSLVEAEEYCEECMDIQTTPRIIEQESVILRPVVPEEDDDNWTFDSDDFVDDED